MYLELNQRQKQNKRARTWTKWRVQWARIEYVSAYIEFDYE